MRYMQSVISMNDVSSILGVHVQTTFIPAKPNKGTILNRGLDKIIN